MDTRLFQKLPANSFKDSQEEKEYLYDLLNFTLSLDSIEDDHPQLVPFLRALLKLLAPLLDIDEIAIILKDYHFHSWMPMISFPESDSIHSSLDFKLLLQHAETTAKTQEIQTVSLDRVHGGMMAYPLVFQEQSIGVLFLFQYNLNIDENNSKTKLSCILDTESDERNKLLKVLWYFNELENDAIRGRLEIWETQSILGKYISSQVMEKIIQSPVSIDFDGQDVEVTVLFADLCEFTKLAENLPSKKIVKLLNTVWSNLVDIAFKYQATVDKFMGDCIMLVFNSPFPQEDHCFRACTTALEFQECMKKLNQDPEWQSYELSLSIGINTGIATSGNIGSKDRLEYTVIGDSINLASRLEEAALSGEIFISEHVHDQVEGAFWIEKGERILVKGRSQPVQVYLLIRNFTQKDLEERFFQHSVELQKNILSNIAFSPELTCADTLCQALTKCDREVGLKILNLFEFYFSVELLPQLVEWLETTDDAFLISKGIKTIAFLGGIPYLKTIEPFLQHKDIRVVSNTIEAVGLTNYKDIFQLIKPLLQHENHRIKLRACQVCWHENQELILDEFMQSLFSDDVSTQKAVVVMLSEFSLDEILFAFLQRYVRLNIEGQNKIRSVVKEYGSTKLARYLKVSDEKTGNSDRLKEAKS